MHCATKSLAAGHEQMLVNVRISRMPVFVAAGGLLGATCWTAPRHMNAAGGMAVQSDPALLCHTNTVLSGCITTGGACRSGIVAGIRWMRTCLAADLGEGSARDFHEFVDS